LFDFEKGFISNYDDHHIDVKSKCYNNLLLPIWAIILITLIGLLVICLALTVCCCCGCWCFRNCLCYKKTHGKSSSSSEKTTRIQDNIVHYPTPPPYIQNPNDGFQFDPNIPVQYPVSDINHGASENQIPFVNYPEPRYE
jgi:hypothetical protein